MKNKFGKFEKLLKMDHAKKKMIKKYDKKPKPAINPKNKPDHESTEKILDYLEQKREEVNILPLSGPNMKQNYVKCAYYSRGSCKYGRNCKYSHNFVEKMTIDTTNTNINLQENPLSFTKQQTLHLPLSLAISHIKIFTVTYKDKRANTFMAVADQARKIYIYALNQRSHLCSFTFRTQEEELIEFEFFPLRFTTNNDCSFNSLTSSNTCMLTIHKNSCMRLWNVFQPRRLKTYAFDFPNLAAGATLIYKIDQVNLMNELMANTKQQIPQHVRAKLAGLKDISTFMVIDRAGTLLFTHLKKGVFLYPINIGVKINDIAFMTSSESSNHFSKNRNEDDIRTLNPYKGNQLKRMPSYVVVAGKGIHVWDLIKKRSVRIMAYNNYAYYLAVAAFEVSEMGVTKCLIAAMGKLHDRIISFGDQVFLEIWNPITGGCIKRITKSSLRFDFDIHADLKCGFLQVFPVRVSEETGERENVCVVSTKNRVEVWNLFNEEKVSELEVSKGIQISFEPFVYEDQDKFLLVDQNVKNNRVETYALQN